MRLSSAVVAAAVALSTALPGAAQGTVGPPSSPQPKRPTAEAPPAPRDEPAPTDETLGIPVYPGAQFLRSYDAGRGQRYYIFGAQASFAELVAYYRTILRQRGMLVFDRPATHMFEVGRYRPTTMAFPPGVTVKDFTASGSGGFPNPRPGRQPARFPTIIQVVPAPAP